MRYSLRDTSSFSSPLFPSCFFSELLHTVLAVPEICMDRVSHNQFISMKRFQCSYDM